MSDATKREDVRMSFKQVLLVLSVIGAGWVMLTAAVTVLDDRFVRRGEFIRLENKVDRLLDLNCAGRESARACQQP